LLLSRPDKQTSSIIIVTKKRKENTRHPAIITISLYQIKLDLSSFGALEPTPVKTTIATTSKVPTTSKLVQILDFKNQTHNQQRNHGNGTPLDSNKPDISHKQHNLQIYAFKIISSLLKIK